MAEYNLPEFSVNAITANEDINQLLKTIKPQWNAEDVEISTISGGFSCATYRVLLKSNSTDAVTIRVRRLFSESSLAIIDHDYERKIVQIASSLGLFPKIHAIFKNGYCYEYVKGKPLINWTVKTGKPLSSEDIPFRKIAQKMAQVHCIKLENEDFSKSNILELYRQTLEENYPDGDDSNLMDKNIIRKELSEMIGYSEKLNLKVVLCHGDMHPGNMVWNEEEGELTLVDWELTHIGYQVYDVEYFLRLFYDIESMDWPDLPKFLGPITENVRETFINFYAEEYAKLATGTTNVSDEYLKEFNNHVKFMQLVLCLTSIILLGALNHKLVDAGLPVDTKKMTAVTFAMYQKSKDKILRELNLK